MEASTKSVAIFLIFLAVAMVEIQAATSTRPEHRTCTVKGRCFLKRITCPIECPKAKPSESKAKGCFIDCNSPKCEAVCRNRKPNCNSPGAACFDPRFIGGDSIVFYFHGRKNEHFSLFSDQNLQINARFIGLRPAGRSRDYTWIQALGIMFDSHTFTLEAKRAVKWDDETDHLELFYDGEQLLLPESHLSEWSSPDRNLTVERIVSKNSISVILAEVAEISINVVPITENDNRVHNYQIPLDDCFAHLEVQFRFSGLSPKVEGVLGRTYRPDFENPAKQGVAMPVVGGEDKYKTSTLTSSDCSSCIFSPTEAMTTEISTMTDSGILDCTSRLGSGHGIVCRK
ncbi:hypothetical protein MRB53_021813 [Persea americana]|uniref:Uncharacterized protein n=1 Tax=Persea americana TaxID=3435 RepID=A0ACC2L5P4_PERAE|nr:hypothetical protein MRB53_021813 [Persea americana]